MTAEAIRDKYRGCGDSQTILLAEAVAQLSEQTELQRQMVKLAEDNIKIGQLRTYGN